MSTLRTSLESLQRQFDSLSESHDVLQNAATRANRVCEETQRQLIAVQGESEHNHAEAAKFRRLVQEKEEEIEGLKQASKPEAPSTHGQESAEWDGLRSQLLQQTDQIRRLEDVNAKMKGELLVLRERHANVEVLKEEKRILERRVRDAEAVREQLGLMEAEVDALRQERENSYVFSFFSELISCSFFSQNCLCPEGCRCPSCSNSRTCSTSYGTREHGWSAPVDDRRAR